MMATKVQPGQDEAAVLAPAPHYVVEQATPGGNGPGPVEGAGVARPAYAALPSGHLSSKNLVVNADEEEAAALAAVAYYIEIEAVAFEEVGVAERAADGAQADAEVVMVGVLPLPIVLATEGIVYTPDEEEAAALAAVTCYMEAEQWLVVADGAHAVAEVVVQEVVPPPIVLATEGIVYTPDEEEAAAALAAVTCYLEAEQRLADEELAHTQETWQWEASRLLLLHGLMPTRAPRRLNWGNIERLRHAGTGVPGIVGM